jgi:hypothetical protein
MKDWNGRCHRCGKETNIHKMSWFNTDLICLDCSAVEEKHPDYQRAKDADSFACTQGNYNFAGIGWPR